MDRTKLVALAAVVMLSSGCATNHKYGVAPWPWPATVALCDGATCQLKHALLAFNQANMFCRQMQDYYAAGGVYAKSGKMTVSTVGAVAGSVIAPLASGSAASAWSGVSGVANGLQSEIDQTFSDAVDVQRRAGIAAAASTGAGAFLDASTDYTAKVFAAMDMARECAMSSGKSDKEALKALVSDS